jgi:hypothetical protein
MITEDFTVVDQFISVPKDMHGLNCASLVGGIVEGMLDGGEFVCNSLIDISLELRIFSEAKKDK